MNQPSTTVVLNRLSVIHHRSLVAYLKYAVPYFWQQSDEAKAVLDLMAADHERIVDKVGEMILEDGVTVQAGEFPMAFTGYHDLGLDFVVQLLIKFQKQIIKNIEVCVEDLTANANSYATAIAEEALGAAKGHLESLEELASVAG